MDIGAAISQYGFPIIAAGAFALQRFMPYIQAAFAGWTYIKSNEEAVSEFLYQTKPTGNSNLYDHSDFQDNKITGDIHFSNITFGYNSKKNIFKNFNLKIKKGQFVAVLGQSGSGKTFTMYGGDIIVVPTQQDGLRLLVVLCLRKQIHSNPVWIGKPIADHQNLARPGDHIEADGAKHLALGSRHIEITRPNDFVDFGY